MGRETPNETPQDNGLDFIPLRADPSQQEVVDVEHGEVIVYTAASMSFSITNRRPLNDRDRWQLSRICSTLDSKIFTG
jgi:hypothetical protein